MMYRTLSVLLENGSVALSQVIGFFSQCGYNGYNIESRIVAPTDDPTLPRMTIQTVSDEKCLSKLKSNYTSWLMCYASA